MNADSADKAPKRENPLLSLLFNLVLPNFILIKGSDEELLGPLLGLIVALSFPVCYAIYDFAVRKNFNLIACLGFVSVLLTGTIGLFEMGGIWFAIKEAAIPAVIGIAIVLTQKSPKPLVRTLFYNDQVIDVHKVDEALSKSGTKEQFEDLLKSSTYLITSSFILSAMINFVLAYTIINSPPGTADFNAEVGYMNSVSYVVIVVPCTAIMLVALWRLINGVRRLTGLPWEEILHQR